MNWKKKSLFDFAENFVKDTRIFFFVKSIIYLFSNFCSKYVTFTKFLSKKKSAVCTVWKNRKFTVASKIFRQINCFVISFVKTLFSRNFCQKCVRVSFCNFHTVWSRLKVLFHTLLTKNSAIWFPEIFEKRLKLRSKLTNISQTQFGNFRTPNFAT